MRPSRAKGITALLGALLLALAGSGPGRAQKEDKGDPTVPAPEFPSGLKWLNSEPLTLQGLRGKVVLVDFWEYTCVNCIRTFPYLKAWNEKYRDKGLVIIGVHTPEFKFAKDEGNVAKGAAKFGLTWPLVNDKDYLTWHTWGNRYWPAKYLIDSQGFVRYLHFGEGGYQTTESWIQKLLKEANPKIDLPDYTPPLRGSDKPGAVCYPTTPELYLGYERGAHEGTLGSLEGYRPGQVVTYKDRGNWEDGMIYFQGPWKNSAEAMISTRSHPTARDYIAIKYHALEANAVIRPEFGKPIRVWVYQDNKPIPQKDRGLDVQYDSLGRSFIMVDQPKMYSLVRNKTFGQHTLKLAPTAPGFGIYTFTFSSCEVPKGG
jgi:thiol-disulfide isomerase/thioredoxin